MSARQYAEGWMSMMVTIWREKMDEFGVYDTGTLQRSFQMDLSKWADESDKGSIIHRFLQYGVYVERGTGREISKDNGGNIGRERTRFPKPWLTRKYKYSVFRLGEYFAERYVNQFCAMMRDTFQDIK